MAAKRKPESQIPFEESDQLLIRPLYATIILLHNRPQYLVVMMWSGIMCLNFCFATRFRDPICLLPGHKKGNNEFSL